MDNEELKPDRARAVPLVERLRRIPKDARLIYEHEQAASTIIPVGLLAHEAADALTRTTP